MLLSIGQRPTSDPTKKNRKSKIHQQCEQHMHSRGKYSPLESTPTPGLQTSCVTQRDTKTKRERLNTFVLRRKSTHKSNGTYDDTIVNEGGPDKSILVPPHKICKASQGGRETLANGLRVWRCMATTTLTPYHHGYIVPFLKVNSLQHPPDRTTQLRLSF